MVHAGPSPRVWGKRLSSTTIEEYVADLHTAIEQVESKLAIYRMEDGRYVLGVLAPNTISRNRLGRGRKAFLWVVYNADYGTIITGFQTKGSVVVPEGAVWIR